MLTIRDYENNEYPLLAVKTITRELNGQHYIELKIPQQNNKSIDISQIDKLWEVTYDNVEYKVLYTKEITKGDSFYLDVRATPLFYFKMDKMIIHNDCDGHYTANAAFRLVFENTGFNFVLVDFSPSIQIDGFGKGETRLEMFKRLVDRFNYEFEIVGDTVYMKHLIGNDTNFMYKHKLNASNVSRSTDASNFFTRIKGFGDFEEGTEDYLKHAKLKQEYTSPLASILGVMEGKPIVDGRLKEGDYLLEKLQQAVEDSLEISIEGNLHDVRSIYKEAVPVIGDRVFLIDERLKLEQEIRIQSLKETRDINDKLIACEITFGSQSIRGRYKANINSLSKKFQDLLNGNLKLPVISLEKIGMDMIKAIHDASSEIIFGDYGMMAISKINPNHVFGLNSEGWYISQDGGRTPKTIATAQGIYADAIFAGTLWLTNEMNIESLDGYLTMSGSNFVMRDKTNKRAVEINPNDGIRVSGGMIRVDRDDGGIPSIIAGKMRFIERIPGTDPAFIHPEVIIKDHRYTHTRASYRTLNAIMFEHTRRYFRISFSAQVSADSPGFDLRLLGFGEDGEYLLKDQRYTVNGIDPIYETIYIDLGPPTGYRVQFYIQTASRKEGEFVQYTGNTYGQTDFKDWELLKLDENK